MLFQEPELVQELVASRATTVIPHSIEFGDCWIELQIALFDFLGAGMDDDPRTDALTPRAGLSFLENKTINSARLVRV